MSLAAQSKYERLQELHAGIHLVIVNNITLLKNPDGTPVEKDGNNFITVRFTDGNNNSIDNNYPIGTEKQRYFDLFIMHIGLDNTKQVNKKEALNKRLWIAVKEVYFLDNSEVVKDENKKEVKEYFVFKTFKYENEKLRPIVKGDPINFGGIPQDDFVDYKLVSDTFTKEEKIKENPMSDSKPSF